MKKILIVIINILILQGCSNDLKHENDLSYLWLNSIVKYTAPPVTVDGDSFTSYAVLQNIISIKNIGNGKGENKDFNCKIIFSHDKYSKTGVYNLHLEKGDSTLISLTTDTLFTFQYSLGFIRDSLDNKLNNKANILFINNNDTLKISKSKSYFIGSVNL